MVDKQKSSIADEIARLDSELETIPEGSLEAKNIEHRRDQLVKISEEAGDDLDVNSDLFNLMNDLDEKGTPYDIVHKDGMIGVKTTTGGFSAGMAHFKQHFQENTMPQLNRLVDQFGLSKQDATGVGEVISDMRENQKMPLGDQDDMEASKKAELDRNEEELAPDTGRGR